MAEQDVALPLTLPVLAERIAVDKRVVETGRVRIHKRVVERDERVELPALARDEIDVRTVAIGRVVDRAEPTRQSGDVTIVPVYEERVVVTRQLVLKEELHITRRRRLEAQTPRTVRLRQMDIDIERVHGTRALAEPEQQDKHPNFEGEGTTPLAEGPDE